LNEQEKLLEYTNRNYKIGPVRTILGVVGTMLNKTGPGRLMKRVSEINTKNKIAKQARKERVRLQEEVTDWSLITAGGLFTYFYQNLTIISAPIIPVINITAKALALTTRDVIVITTIKKYGATYTGVLIQSRFSAPIAIVLTIISWKLTLRIARTSGYTIAHLGRFLFPRLPE
jgi:hypothetical protein